MQAQVMKMRETGERNGTDAARQRIPQGDARVQVDDRRPRASFQRKIMALACAGRGRKEMPTTQSKQIVAQGRAGKRRAGPLASQTPAKGGEHKTQDNQNGSSLIQCSTALRYENDKLIHPSTPLTGIIHERVPMTDDQRKNAWKPSRYQPGPGEFCNHCVPYKMIRDSVMKKFEGKQVQWGLAEAGLIGPAHHKMMNGQYIEDDIAELIDQHISGVANNSRNLFYWPRHTGDAAGTAIDYPVADETNKYDYGIVIYGLRQYAKSKGFLI